MQKWYQIFPKNTGLSLYVWIIFCILPFYFIFRSTSTFVVSIGAVAIILFFISYRSSFISNGWLVFLWTSIQIIISVAMTILYGYVYFSLFTSYFIGNIKNKVGFYTFYTIHLISILVAINIGFISKNPMLLSQIPFILICILAVILLPHTTYNRNKQEQLEGQLEDANRRIAELGKIEERQRIARDLHDTLGQKLSLIGLKSDLAGKLIQIDPDSAKKELRDIRKTARTALKEVREMVSEMRGTKLEAEITHVRQILKAAEIDLQLVGNFKKTYVPLFVESVLSMCLKEAVTNIVKHSRATTCTICLEQQSNGLLLKVQDNGVGLTATSDFSRGNGLQGIQERLEFLNGSLSIHSDRGTTISMMVPKVIQH